MMWREYIEALILSIMITIILIIFVTGIVLKGSAVDNETYKNYCIQSGHHEYRAVYGDHYCIRWGAEPEIVRIDAEEVE